MQPAAATLGYDRAITIFSPDGRLFQVQYAGEAVRKGATALGLKYDRGVILITDKRLVSKLVEPASVEKMFEVDKHICCASSGLIADARVLVDRGRLEAEINRLSYGEPIQVETLAKRISDLIQTYTQYSGVRPFGIALLIAGVDEAGPRLFETDPAGALTGYKATVIGSGREIVMGRFEKEYRDGMKKDDAVLLGLRALKDATDGEISVDSVEIGVVDETRRFKKLPSSEVKAYLDQIG